MEVQQLRHLLAASSSTSFARAAAKCFTSRQNIAHSVKAIEAELGVPLFERRGNTMVLTEKGADVVAVAEEIVSDIDSLRSMFSGSFQSPALSVAFSTNLFAGAPDEVDEVIKLYCDRLRFFELECERCYEQIVSKNVDVAIVMCMDRRFPKCEAVRVGGSSAYALTNETSHLAAKQCCTAADLLGKRLVLMSEPPFQYEPLCCQIGLLGYDLSFANVASSTSSMVHLVRDRDYIGIVSGKFAKKPPSGTTAVPIADPRMNWGFYILYKDERSLKGNASDFVNSVVKAFGIYGSASR